MLGTDEQFMARTWEQHAKVMDRGCALPLLASLPSARNGRIAKLLGRAPSPSTGCPAHALLRRDGDTVDRGDYASWSHALLDGVSLIVNRADYLDESVREACRDVCRSTGLPHCYTNVYVTPPRSRAVGAHADDRDVFIVQIDGSKRWLVWDSPPIPFPYSDEQVGKQLPVPELGVPAIDVMLDAGDVLYVPRGWVHRAETARNSSSHATFALATHDWTWASVAAAVLRSSLDADLRWRRALPLSEPLDARPLAEAAAAALDSAALEREFRRRIELQWRRDDSIIQRIATDVPEGHAGLALESTVARADDDDALIEAVVTTTPRVYADVLAVLDQIPPKNASVRIADLADDDDLRKICLADLAMLMGRLCLTPQA